MKFSDSLDYFFCYWKFSYSPLAKLALFWYYFQRVIFKLGTFGSGEDKISALKLDKFKIYFNLKSPEIGSFREIFDERVYEQEKDFIPQKGWIVLDIGANIGVYALRNSSRIGTGKILSFEPNYQVYSLFLKNIKCNKISNVEAFPVAIGGKTGLAEFLVSPFSTRSGRIMQWNNKIINSTNLIKFPVIMDTLDNFAEIINLTRPIDMIKMDIEGAELDAIYGGINVLQRTKRIVMEYHDEDIFKKIKQTLSNYGFNCIRTLQRNNIAYFLKML